jgi:uncharacterized alpha-E superfamily protein
MSAGTIAGFLLQNRAFPRAVALCVNDIDRTLHELRSRYGLRGGAKVLERIDELQAELTGRPIEQILIAGLHEFLDMTQKSLGLLALDIAREFFHRDEAAPRGMTQNQ